MNDNVDYTSFTQPHTAIYSWPILQRYIWPMHSYCCQRWSVRILVATGRWSYYVELVRTIEVIKNPNTSISKRGRVRSERDVIYWFLTAANLLLTPGRKVRTTVFRRQNSTFRKVFFGNWAALQCCCPSLEYCVRVWCKLIRKWPINTPISVTW